MGSDLTVVNAARVSFDKESEWEQEEIIDSLGPNKFLEGYKLVLSEKDQKLIKYLATHDHYTPFTHVHITMRETVPIFVARQRFKHTVGTSYNEVSRRYVDDTPTFFYPDGWRLRAENKKQGSSDEISPKDMFWDKRYEVHIDNSIALYEAMIEDGIAPEQARMVLPQSMNTSYYVTGSLYAWANAYKKRIDGHAQQEIRELAVKWGEIIRSIPELKHSWEALTQST